MPETSKSGGNSSEVNLLLRLSNDIVVVSPKLLRIENGSNTGCTYAFLKLMVVPFSMNATLTATIFNTGEVRIIIALPCINCLLYSRVELM